MNQLGHMGVLPSTILMQNQTGDWLVSYIFKNSGSIIIIYWGYYHNILGLLFDTTITYLKIS